MDPLDIGYRNVWLIVYIVAGLGVVIKLVGDAYTNTLDLCHMYAHFSFQETLVEEIMMHHMWLPLVHVYVPTLYLLSAYLVIYAAKHWSLLDQIIWPLVLDARQWVDRHLFEIIPTYLLSRGLEPDIPELLSEDEIRDVDRSEQDVDRSEQDVDEISELPRDEEAYHTALAKLVQVKLQHANRVISRPDDWLVFDPVQEKLVLQKETKCTNYSIRDQHSNKSHVDQWREQTVRRDRDEALVVVTQATDLGMMRTGRDIDAEVQRNQPPEVPTISTI